MGFLELKTGPSLVLKTGPSFLGIFENTNSVTLCQNSVFFCKILGMSKMRYSKRSCLFYVGETETEKRKKENGKVQKHYKNSVS